MIIDTQKFYKFDTEIEWNWLHCIFTVRFICNKTKIEYKQPKKNKIKFVFNDWLLDQIFDNKKTCLVASILLFFAFVRHFPQFFSISLLLLLPEFKKYQKENSLFLYWNSKSWQYRIAAVNNHTLGGFSDETQQPKVTLNSECQCKRTTWFFDYALMFLTFNWLHEL